MNKAHTSVIVVTLLLMGYMALFVTGASITLLSCLFLLSPLLIIWMVYTVIADTQYKYPELAEGEEWGYQDKDKSKLGTF